MRARSKVLIFALCMSVVGPMATAADTKPSFVLQGATQGARDVLVPPSNAAFLLFMRGDAASAASLSLYLSEFVSEGDRVAGVKFGAASAGSGGLELRLDVPAKQREVSALLRFDDLVEGESYTGTLSVSDGATLDDWKLTVRSPRKLAALASDVPKATVSCVVPWWRIALAQLRLSSDWEWPCSEGGSFTLTLRDKDGVHRIEGVTVRREPEADGSSLDLHKNFTFSIDGAEVPGLDRWPTGGEPAEETELRSIPPGGQRVLGVRLRGLSAGEHAINLRVAAVNAPEDDTQTLDLTIEARHHFSGALLLLLVAILVSFGVTKGLGNWRRRLHMQARIGSLRRDWLQALPPLPPLVWLRATRRQVRAILALKLVPAAETLTRRLDCAERMLDVLQSYREAESALRDASLPLMLNYLAERELDGLVNSIDPEVLDDTAATDTKVRFASLATTFATPVVHFRERVVKKALKTLVDLRKDRINPKETESSAEAAEALKFGAILDHKETILSQKAGYEPAGSVDQLGLDHLDQLEEVAQLTAFFEVCWRHRENPADLRALRKTVCDSMNAATDPIDLDRLFQKANQLVWNQIKIAAGPDGDAKGIHIEPGESHRPPDRPEAFRPITFRLVADDPSLEESVLLNTRIRCEWKFKLTPHKKPSRRVRRLLSDWLRTDGSDRAASDTITWTDHTEGRKIVQFAPEAGMLQIKAIASHTSRLEPIVADLRIDRAGELGRLQGFALSEGVLLAVSAGLAVLSGLSLYYADNAVFGSFKEYVALLTWGIGVDQGKSLIQTFQSLSSASGDESQKAGGEA